jgi:hypothetical protein
MISFGRPVLAVALVLMLAPLANEVRMTGAWSIDPEPARGGKPAYPPCAWAKAGRTCYSGNGLSIALGHRRRW